MGVLVALNATSPEARAQDADGARSPGEASAPLDPVVVSASRSSQRVFDAPASIQAIGSDVVGTAGPQVNLSESLNRIPGVSVMNRQNYSQDLQLSIRGFGARSTFGIRGVRLLIDGIPATMPDGQGQASTISLLGVDRIEVLKGPLAQLYGNAAGGVLQAFTRAAPSQPYGDVQFAAGRYGMRRWGLSAGGQYGAWNARVDVSDLSADGYRDHSAVRRRQFNGRLQFDPTDDTRLTIVANVFDQPRAEDPLGLTRAQMSQDRRQAVPIAYQQQTGKRVEQQQLGAVLAHRIDASQRVTLRVYGGERDLYNWLAIPLAAQQAATSAGGIVDFDRQYGGLGLLYQRDQDLGAAGRLQMTAGLDLDTMREARRGYVNDGGVAGPLKRDEINRVTNRDGFAQLSWLPDADWTLTGGLRASRVAFRSADRFVTAGNPDDSGARQYSAVNPVLGVTRHVGERLNLYANVGRGFETPTFTELAYRRGGSGMNLALDASRSRHAEVGVKFRPSARQSLDLALFGIRTDSELVVDQNVGGRTTYRNGGPSRREGAELSWRGEWAGGWSSQAALTWMRARLRGDDDQWRRLPGVADRLAYAELAWTPRGTPDGRPRTTQVGAWRLGAPTVALELVHVGRVFVDDVNSDAAGAYTLWNLRAAWEQRIGRWTLRELIRVDNLTGRRYVGSVIVNDSNQRFFEPAPGRAWMAGLSVSYAFD